MLTRPMQQMHTRILNREFNSILCPMEYTTLLCISGDLSPPPATSSTQAIKSEGYICCYLSFTFIRSTSSTSLLAAFLFHCRTTICMLFGTSRACNRASCKQATVQRPHQMLSFAAHTALARPPLHALAWLDQPGML